MTYTANIQFDKYTGLIDLSVRNGSKGSAVRIKPKAELVKSALSTYDLDKVRIRGNVPKSIKTADFGTRVDLVG